MEKLLLPSSNIFRDESVFDPAFRSEVIPHREKEHSLLSQLFLTLITNPNSISRKILITGPPHTGKSKIIKIFANMLLHAGEKRHVNFYIPFLSCYDHNTRQQLLAQLCEQLPSRWKRIIYRIRDLICHPKTYTQRKSHFLIILDDFEFYRDDWDELLESITSRVVRNRNLTRVSYITIISNEQILEKKTLNPKLRRNMLRFSPYSKNQLFDILKYRANLGFKPGIVSDDHIAMVVDYVFKKQDGITYGLEILRKAGKFAENDHRNFIRFEDVRNAIFCIYKVYYE